MAFFCLLSSRVGELVEGNGWGRIRHTRCESVRGATPYIM
ncbi:hypothetical protein HMPREF0670_02135 [Prevotella sp. oral taxon 317 str. F0108]|nr:hypothetical protein HMPREF0670_02135 [Prevotella sp. oral taxon 317 str. F0108]